MTVLPPESSAPRPTAGTRSRAGNAMARTRTAVLDGVLRAVEKHGSRRTTMGDVAELAGIAKATLYNHFRTKPDLYAATVEAEVRGLGAECEQVARDEGLAAALARAAERLGTSAAVRRVASDEPAVLARLTTPGDGGVWPVARTAVGAVLRAAAAPADAASVELVLRWLVTHLAAPGGDEERAAGARVLVRGLAGSAQSGPGPGWHPGHQ